MRYVAFVADKFSLRVHPDMRSRQLLFEHDVQSRLDGPHGEFSARVRERGMIRPFGGDQGPGDRIPFIVLDHAVDGRMQSGDGEFTDWTVLLEFGGDPVQPIDVPLRRLEIRIGQTSKRYLIC